MNRLATYLLIILSLLITTTMPARASTDYIVYAFNEVDGYTEVAKGAIDKVSQVSQIINSAKTMVGGYLGDKVAAIQEKAELAQEKVENAQEKAEKVKERIEWAKEKKAALMEKYNEISTKIAEYKQQATEAIQKGMEIRDKYKTYVDKVSEYKDKATEAIEDVKDLKNKVEDKVNEAKGLAESKLNQVKDKVGTSPEENKTSTESIAITGNNQPKSDGIFDGSTVSIQPTSGLNSQQISTVAVAQPQKEYSNQADAIRSAGILAQEVKVDNVSAPDIEELEQEAPLLQQSNISAAEIMDSAKNIKPRMDEAQSDLKLEDQLTSSSNKTETKNNPDKQKVLMMSAQVSSNREKFEAEEKEISLKIEEKAKIEEGKGAEK